MQFARGLQLSVSRSHSSMSVAEKTKLSVKSVSCDSIYAFFAVLLSSLSYKNLVGSLIGLIARMFEVQACVQRKPAIDKQSSHIPYPGRSLLHIQGHIHSCRNQDS